MSEIAALILAIISAITAYPVLRKGIIAIKGDVEALIRELKQRRKKD